MNHDTIVFWLTWIGLACWAVCFWWMRRISSRQDALLAQLKAQGRRIEALSKAEHDLIKEVHPQVGEIKESMQEVVESVRENAETASQTKPQAALAKKK
jgi:methyl-accepting chemotaxis protein